MAEDTGFNLGGLLDFAKTPEGQGLLSAAFGGMAGARRGAPWNTAGIAGISGLHGYTQAQNNLVDQQQKQLDQQQKKLQLDITQRAYNEMQGGGQQQTLTAPQAALVAGAQNGSVGPTVANANLIGQMPDKTTIQRPATGGISLRTLQLLGLSGGKNVEPLFSMYKYENDGIERKPGTWYKSPVTGDMEYTNDPGKGFNYDPSTNSISTINGYSKFLSDTEGSKTEAQERGKAKYTPLPSNYVGSDGRPIGGTVLEYVGQGGSQQGSQNQPLWLQSRISYLNGIQDPQEKQSFVNAVYNSFRGNRNADQLSNMWTNAINGGGGTYGGRPRLQSKAEETSAVNQAAANVDLAKSSLSGYVKEADAQQGLMQTLNQAESLIKAGTLGNSPSDKASMTAHNWGLRQTPETIRTANLEKMGNQLVLARGSLGAGVSSSDADRYDQAAGNFTRAQSNEERLQYIKIMRDIANKQFQRTNQAMDSFRSTGQMPTYGASSGGRPSDISALLKKYGR